MIGQACDTWCKWIRYQIALYVLEELKYRTTESRNQAALAAFAYHDINGEYPENATDEIKELCERIKKDRVAANG